jgi:hypothetical protein
MITINNLADQNFPDKLHDKIMRKIFFIKLRTPFLFIITLSCFNLINYAWHFINQAAEMQTWSVISTMFDHFELSSDYLGSFIQTTMENTPINLMIGLIINSILVYYLIYIFQYFKRSNQTQLNKNFNL